MARNCDRGAGGGAGGKTLGVGMGGGGGAGGGIYINCKRFEGTSSGILSARGGNGNASGGAGGGGRIGVIYNTTAQAGYNPGVRFDTSRGTGGFSANTGRESEDGTLYLPDISFLSTNISGGIFYQVYLTIPAFTNWSVANLTIDNSRLYFSSTNLTINITNDLTIQNNAAIGLMGHSSLIARDINFTGNGYLVARSGPTNNPAKKYGVLVRAIRNMNIASGSWVYPYSDPTNGASPKFMARNITVQTNAGFNADGKGYWFIRGPGLGTSWSGAGHGGRGGNGASGTGGSVYGSSNTPVTAGSGGCYEPGGGNGGGVIRIETTGKATIYGTLRANGDNNCVLHGGGGSGGSVFLACNELVTSPNTLFSTKGGNGTGNGGAGGGGRVAIWYHHANPEVLTDPTRFIVSNCPDYLGTISVTNGTGYYNPPSPFAAAPGTICYVKGPMPGSVFMIK